MKKTILILFFTFITLTGVFAQRFAYVDSEYILKHMPEYASAQKQIEALSVQWQKEVDVRFQEIDRLYKAYQADQVLMTAEIKKKQQKIFSVKNLDRMESLRKKAIQ
jgi:outer membrane protein